MIDYKQLKDEYKGFMESHEKNKNQRRYDNLYYHLAERIELTLKMCGIDTSFLKD